MEEVEKAYIAGIMDGEGTITITKQKYYLKNKEFRYSYHPCIMVSNCNIEVLDWIVNKTRFKIYPGKHIDKRNCKYQPQYIRTFKGFIKKRKDIKVKRKDYFFK